VRFQPSRLDPADPIKRHRARRERSHPKEMLTTQTSAGALDLLENSIDPKRTCVQPCLRPFVNSRADVLSIGRLDIFRELNKSLVGTAEQKSST
jgi:hypothetical protein